LLARGAALGAAEVHNNATTITERALISFVGQKFIQASGHPFQVSSAPEYPSAFRADQEPAVAIVDIRWHQVANILLRDEEQFLIAGETSAEGFLETDKLPLA